MMSQLTPITEVISHFQKVDKKVAEVLPSITWSDWFEDVESSDHFYNLTKNIIYKLVT